MDLRIISLFEDLTDTELAQVASACSIRSYARHEEIYGEREMTTDIFFILAGAVRVTSFTETGREVIYSDLDTGAMFGEFSAIDRLPRSASIVALTDCKLARMPASAFFDLLRRNNDVAVRLVQLLVAKIRAMSKRVFVVTVLNVGDRLRDELLTLATTMGQQDGEGVTIARAPTHYEIAARIGSHREAVTREFNRLKREKVLESRGRTIRIIDMRRLRSLM